ncbi:hypothetical protein [Hymenobacter saemangeumensis]
MIQVSVRTVDEANEYWIAGTINPPDSMYAYLATDVIAGHLVVLCEEKPGRCPGRLALHEVQRRIRERGVRLRDRFWLFEAPQCVLLLNKGNGDLVSKRCH